jgi:diaminohydroxyphosphoribosylaminopyrimidine deaminase/5-amino-6-(5-phosphoribosylamino)uracil reductase
MFSEFDRIAMMRALALAERGFETTHPNPRVGCVIAKGDRIIAEGWHERAGEAHAEVAALRAAKEPVAGATAYVTLEPCSHFGRTPPCVNALIEARIGRVVFAVQDPNPLVSGKGADALLRAGIEVEAGLMEAEATEINIGFMKRMKHGLPWVRVKLAMSLDGRTALANGASQWITGEYARNDVQRWRARSSAIMTGVGTVLADDPQLNVRIPGFKGQQPLRVVLDAHLRSPPGAKMFVGLGARASAAATASGSPAAMGDVLIFTAIGSSGSRADPAGTGVPMDPATLAQDMAELVNAFESSPGAVAAAPGSGDAPPPADAPAADDATWAGAALSGAVPVKSETKKAPAGDGMGADRVAAAVTPGTTGTSAVTTATSPGSPSGPSAPAATASGMVSSARASAGSTSAADASRTAPATSRLAAPSNPPTKSDSPQALQARRAALVARGVRFEEVAADEGYLDLLAVLQKLGELNVNEVLVEAGPTLAGQLLTTFFADELLLYVAPKLLGPQGRPLVNLPELQSLQDAWGFSLFDAKRFGDDLRLRLRPK